jgi:hypothetical protein
MSLLGLYPALVTQFHTEVGRTIPDPPPLTLDSVLLRSLFTFWHTMTLT